MLFSRSFLFFLVFFPFFSLDAQLDAMFFFKEVGNRRGIPDEEEIAKGGKAARLMMTGKHDSAEGIYRELLREHPGNVPLYLHLAVDHSYQREEDSVRKYLGLWLDSLRENAVCECFRSSPHFEPYDRAHWMKELFHRCWRIKMEAKEPWGNSISDPPLADSIRYYHMIDQEILQRPCSYGLQDAEKSYRLRWENFQKLTELIDTTDLPSSETIGGATGRIITMIRHLDHMPRFQIRMGERMLRDSSKGYSVRSAAILIDEGCANLGREPRYGVIEAETGKYEELGDLDALNERRRRIGLKPVDP